MHFPQHATEPQVNVNKFIWSKIGCCYSGTFRMSSNFKQVKTVQIINQSSKTMLDALESDKKPLFFCCVSPPRPPKIYNFKSSQAAK